MEGKFAKRKKKFWTLCLVFVMVIVQAVPIDVIAAESYTLTGTGSDSTFGTERLQPGDTLSHTRYAGINVEYYDTNGNLITTDAAEENTYSYTVQSYMGSSISADNFKEWEVYSIHNSGSYAIGLKLYAVEYTQSSITYILGEGTVENPNPTTYREGMAITLEDATKEGYTFEGWYKENTFDNPVTSISTTDTGAITLYAKFTPATYNITYVLDGGDNEEGNPNSYTYNIGVSSFANAKKDGYTFDGWYSDREFNTKIEGISQTKTGPVTLYAKFNANNYGITYNLDGGDNGAGNPTGYTCGKGVAGFTDANKAGYDFKGWYSDEACTIEKNTISDKEFGPVTLYAKFIPKTYKITYNLDGGSNGAGNPTGYTYGVGGISFTDAVKEGHTFDGWYSDSKFTTEVKEITKTQTGDITLYAKFTPETYGITYELDGGSNGAGNPAVYTYGVGVTSFADAVKDRYTFEGWYAENAYKTKINSISKTKTGVITLYAKFAKILKAGEGTITVDDVYYGTSPVPVVKSATNGTNHVTVQYKQKNAADNTYTDVKPTAVGNYTARAVFAKTDDYLQVVATDDFYIGYFAAPETPYRINGTKGGNDFYTSDVTIVPATGFLISDSPIGTFQRQMKLSTTRKNFSVYLKKTDTGAITSAIDVSEIKIDKDAPVISGAQSGETIYGDEAKMEVTDENLSQILVNGETVEFENGKATLNLSSNQGEEKYEIVVVDRAGNRSSKQIVVAAEWMKSKVIPVGKKVRLYRNYSYTFGGGKWKVSGDSTTYVGNSSFYVNSEGDYSFSRVN